MAAAFPPKPKRVPIHRRIAIAARVLRRFDLQMLMLSAQVSNPAPARSFINAGLDTGSIIGPPLGRRVNTVGLQWTFVTPGASNR